MQKFPPPTLTSPTCTIMSSGWNLRLQHLKGSVTRLTESTMLKLSIRSMSTRAGVADQAQHSLVLALGDVHAKALIFEPVDKLLALVLFCATLEYDDHNNFLLIDREISPQRKNAAQV